MKEAQPKVLWVSLMAPYDKVRHAGGKIENHYLKKFHAAAGAQLKLVTLCKKDEVPEIDLDEYGIDHKLFVRKREGVFGFTSRVFSWLSEFNVFNAYAGLTPRDVHRSLTKLLHEVADEGFSPDIVILQWTQVIFLLPIIKALFPNARLTAIEEDVSFLGLERKIEYSTGPKKWLFTAKHRRVKKMELHYLSQCDLVILNNRKDEKLLHDNGLAAKTWVWTPFFQTMLDTPRQPANKHILFYGAMFREENWKSVVWFIENVFCKIEDPDIQFHIIGNKPPKRILNYASERVHVHGFVDDISKIFSEAMCLVAPLVLGAGVKIKVLEGFSAGIPVLTNHIGIEGIDAQDGRDFFFCDTANSYIEAINRLASGDIDQQAIELNAKSLIRDTYNYDQDAETFTEKVLSLGTTKS